MKTLIRLSLILFLNIHLLFTSNPDKTFSLYSDNSALKNSSFGFLENKGQLKNDAVFYFFGKNQNILIFKDRLVFDFHRNDSVKNESLATSNIKNSKLKQQKSLFRKLGLVITLEFLNFNHNYSIETFDEIEQINIFKGGNEFYGIRKFRTIKLKDIYKNIDLVLGFDKGKFRFDLNLNKNANSDDIKFKIKGADEIKLKSIDGLENKNQLELISETGKVFFGEITSFYSANNKQNETLSYNEFVDTDYILNDNILSFKVDKYDNSRELVIDPVVYSTFFGGLDVDEITDIVKDKNEDIIITGWSRSENFRTTSGTYDTLFYSETDCFVSKFRLIGIERKLIFSTLIGGNADEYAKSISLDPDGNIYIAGETESFDYPVKNTPYSKYSGLKDGFISKFSNDGKKLLYSSYFGGSKQDIINSIAAGGSGEIYITGGTYSSDIPITITYNDNNPNNKGLEEAFITKFYSNGSIQYSYLLTSLGFEYGSVIALNEKAGMLVVGGQTNSPDLITFPKTGDNIVIDYVYNGGQDIFLAMFTPGLGNFNFCTFIGGSGDDIVNDILIDEEGNIFVAGETSTKNASVNPTVISTDFRITNTAYQKKNNGGSDAFLMVLNRNGTKLIGSTFLGGKNNDSFLSMDFNSNKTSIFLTGYTQSSDFPKANAEENERYLAKKDVIISNLSIDGSKLLYSTIISAAGDDVAKGIVIDKFEGINIVGTTNSNDFPLFEPLESSYMGGISDGFIYRRLQKTLKVTANLKSFEYCQNENIYLSWLADGFEKGHQFFVEVSTDNGKSWIPIVSNYDRFEYIWKIPADFPAGQQNKIRVYSPSGVVAVSDGNFTILSSPRIKKIELNSNENVFCEGESLEINTEVEGEQLKFQWEKDGKQLSGKTLQNLVLYNLSLADQGTYTLSVSGKCKPDVKSSIINIIIKPKTEIISDLEDKKAKINENVEFKIQAKGLKLSFEWQRNGIKMMNQTDSILRLNNVNLNSQGYYRCIVNGECGSDTSKNVYLTVDTTTSSIYDFINDIDDIKIRSFYSKSYDDALEIFSDYENEIDILICDLNGRLIKSIKDVKLENGKNRFQLNFDEFSIGLYSVTINSHHFTKKKLILIYE
ncbi:MAG: SBBP repeat-containing protein [Candidatus Kapabacteria bacterium]|nr:SBBP repeat-containing protein [Candidatus Kapabacteria bacterium]